MLDDWMDQRRDGQASTFRSKQDRFTFNVYREQAERLSHCSEVEEPGSESPIMPQVLPLFYSNILCNEMFGILIFYPG